MRRGRDRPGPDAAGSSWFQRPHLRAQPSPSSRLGAPQGKRILKGKKTHPAGGKQRTAAQGTRLRAQAGGRQSLVNKKKKKIPFQQYKGHRLLCQTRTQRLCITAAPKPPRTPARSDIQISAGMEKVLELLSFTEKEAQRFRATCVVPSSFFCYSKISAP